MALVTELVSGIFILAHSALQNIALLSVMFRYHFSKGVEE